MEQIISVLLQASGAGQFSSQMMQMTNAANVTQRAIQSMQGVVTGIKAAVIGAVGGVSIAAVAQLGSSFENTQNKMAGFLNALGQAPDFNHALKMSEGVMRQIELTSAALPGEAEDYVRVFTTALPSVQKSLGGTMDQMVAFTNQIAAVGATFGIDSMQVANDLNRMVQVGRGGAGLDVRTFTSMLPFLQRVEGHANLTAEAFNKMNEQARAKLLQKGMAALSPMIDHAANSFDAIKGTSQSILKTMFRMATGGLFEGLKSSLKRINSLLMDENGNLTAFAHRIIDYGKRASTVIVGITDRVVSFLESVFADADKIPAVFERIESSVIGAAKGMIAFSAAQTAFGLFTKGSGGAAGGLLGGMGQLAGMLAPGGALTAGLVAAAGAAVVAGSAAYVLSTDWEQFAPRVQEVTQQFDSQVIPSLKRAADSAWRITEPFARFIGKAAVNLAVDSVEVLGFTVSKTADTVDDFTYLMSELGKVLSAGGREGNVMLQIARQQKAKRDADIAKTNYRYDMIANAPKPFRMAADFDPSFTPKGPPSARNIPTGRGGVKVVQDFRGSRFTIDQKFEEGFDPDRIAVAFANDLKKVGEYRLQSGLEPLFGGGF